jgi:Zn-dependent protease with chaperone function
MPFLLLLLLSLACLPIQWPQPPPWIGLLGSAGLTWASVALAVGTAAFLAQWTRRQLRRDPGRRENILQRHVTGRFYHLIGLFVVYGVALYGLGWGWVVQTVCSLDTLLPDGSVPLLPGGELLIAAPFLVALVLSWACFYDAEQALHDTSALAGGSPFWSRWTYVGFHVRHNLALVCVPIAILILEQGFCRLFPDVHNDWWFQFGAVALLATVFVTMPWALRVLLGLRPLPAGPLRDRLLASARRLNFRCSDILLWDTRGGVANAMVVGILPWIRYVLLTDRLTVEMTQDEVEAVFGHEVGHVKHNHMLYYLGFLLVSLVVVMMVWKAIDLQTLLDRNTREDLAVLPLVASLGAYIFVVFGFLSRRCERQADIYGCRAVSCARNDCGGHDDETTLLPGGRGLCPTGVRTFMEALEKVARLNGISRDRPGWLQSWQHSTIARRVEFLQRILHDPTVEPRFQRRVGLVKWGLFVGLGTALFLLGRTQGWANLLF